MGGADPSSGSPCQIKHPSLENWSNQPQIAVSPRRIRIQISSRRSSVSNITESFVKSSVKRSALIIERPVVLFQHHQHQVINWKLLLLLKNVIDDLSSRDKCVFTKY